MNELREQIQEIISTEPVSVFMKGTPTGRCARSGLRGHP